MDTMTATHILAQVFLKTLQGDKTAMKNAVVLFVFISSTLNEKASVIIQSALTLAVEMFISELPEADKIGAIAKIAEISGKLTTDSITSLTATAAEIKAMSEKYEAIIEKFDTSNL